MSFWLEAFFAFLIELHEPAPPMHITRTSIPRLPAAGTGVGLAPLKPGDAALGY